MGSTALFKAPDDMAVLLQVGMKAQIRDSFIASAR